MQKNHVGGKKPHNIHSWLKQNIQKTNSNRGNGKPSRLLTFQVTWHGRAAFLLLSSTMFQRHHPKAMLFSKLCLVIPIQLGFWLQIADCWSRLQHRACTAGLSPRHRAGVSLCKEHHASGAQVCQTRIQALLGLCSGKLAENWNLEISRKRKLAISIIVPGSSRDLGSCVDWG